MRVPGLLLGLQVKTKHIFPFRLLLTVLLEYQEKGQKSGVTCTRAAHVTDAEQTGRSNTSGGTAQVIKMLTAVPDFSVTSQTRWERR